MFKLLTTLIAIILLSKTYLGCDTGCLKCADAKEATTASDASATNECAVPDLHNKFVLDGQGSVKKVEVDKCLLINMGGFCLLCEPDHFLDPSLNSCVLVEENDRFPDCRDYSKGPSCSACKTEFYLENKECKSVTKKVENCLDYKTEDLCSTCNEGFLLSLDSNTCIANPKIANCVAYSYVNCKACLKGFIKDLNGYIASLLQIETGDLKEDLIKTAFTWLSSSDNVAPQISCLTQAPVNCATFNPNLKLCTSCNEGYFMNTENKCEKHPEGPIVNCSRYSSLTKCIECIPMHYFQNEKCVAISNDLLVDNCAKYNTALDVISCVECNKDHYLKLTVCEERKESKDSTITGCKTKSIDKDNCAVCNDNNHLTDDGLQCLSALPNCTVYQSVNKDGKLTCQTCKTGYVLVTNSDANADPKTECKEGNITNCLAYLSGDMDTCISCANGFVLAGDECKPNNDITNCTVYNSTDKTICDKCNPQSDFRFIIKNDCKKIVNQIPHCSKHEGGTLENPQCIECESGYTLNNNTSCDAASAISVSPHKSFTNAANITDCATSAADSPCTQCNTTLALSPDGLACVATPALFSTNCATVNTSADPSEIVIDSVSCDTCAVNHLPIDFSGSNYCIVSADLAKYVSFTAVTDCMKYNAAGTCVLCNPGAANKYLNSSNACVSACADPQFSSRLVDMTFTPNPNDPTKVTVSVNGFNKCITGSATCSVYAQDLTVITQADICVDCPANHFKTVTYNATKYTNVDTTASFPYKMNLLGKYPEITCKDKTGDPSIGGLANNNINFDTNCLYYHEVTTNVYGCIKCKIGHIGVFQADANGNDGFIKCEADAANCEGFGLGNLDLHWEMLFSCQVCKTGSEIPFVAYVAQSSTSPLFKRWKRWDTTQRFGTTSFATDNGDKKTQICLDNINTSFGSFTDEGNSVRVDYPSDDYNIPDNCALGVVIVDTNGPTNIGSQNYQLLCAACKPGYNATKTMLDGASASYVTECTEITNCNKTASKIVNGCSVCEASHLLQTKPNSKEIDTSACVSIAGNTHLGNCIVMTPEGKCSVCNDSYFLNNDGYCEQLTIPDCTNSGIMKPFDLDIKGDNNMIEWFLNYVNQPKSCNVCDTGKVSIVAKSGKTCLTTNTYIASKPTSTTYLLGCGQFNTDRSCNACHADSDYSLENKTCVLAQNDNSQCDSGFAVSSGGSTCVAPLHYATDLCLENSTQDGNANTETFKEVSCVKCKENAYGIDINNNFVCVFNSDVSYFGIFTPVADCIRYDSSLSCIQCDPTATNKFLKSDNSCGADCGGTSTNTYEKIKLEMTESNTKFTIKGFNICITEDNTCNQMVPDLSNNLASVCGSCASNLMVVNPVTDTKYTNVDINSTAAPYIPNIFARFPIGTCTAIAGIKIDDVGTAADTSALGGDNCDFYFDTGTTSIHTCLRCSAGLTGVVSSIGMMNGCADSSDCSSDLYSNVPLHWARLFSCHKCDTASNIPFISYVPQGDYDLNFKKWREGPSDDGTNTDGWNGNGQFVNAPNSKNIICASNAHGTWGYDDASDYPVDTNCAMAGVNINIRTLTEKDWDIYKVFCAVCKPGYLPTYHDLVPLVVTSCTAITNCDSASANMVNGCDVCVAGNILKYSDKNIQYTASDACITVPADKTALFANCYAATEAGGNAVECAVCKKGYDLSPDKLCVKIQIYECQNDNFTKGGSFTYKGKQEWLLYMKSDAIGCTSCESNHISIKQETSINVCVNSNYIKDIVDTKARDETEFVPFCKHYNAATDSIKCLECKSNYTITGSNDTIVGTACYLTSELPENCKYAIDSSGCGTCTNNTYTLFDKKCYVRSIDDCTQYDFGNERDRPNCTNCTARTAINGHCSHKCTITNGEQCLSCSDAGSGTAISEDGTTCVTPFEYSIPNCDETSIVTNSGAVKIRNVSCTKCSINAYPISLKDQFVCVKDDTINEFVAGIITPNCVKYDDEMNCIMCNPNHANKFLSIEGTCVSRCNEKDKGTYALFELERYPENDPTKIEIKSFNKCLPQDDSCYKKAPNLGNDELTYVCFECTDDYFPVIITKTTNFSIINDDFTDQIAGNAFEHTPAVNCIPKEGNNINESAAQHHNISSDECQKYVSVSEDNYTCGLCDNGIVGTIDDSGYMVCDIENSCTFDATIFNIGVHWQNLFSCTTCTTGIPFLGFKPENIDNTFYFNAWKRWRSTRIANIYENTSGNNKNIMCLENEGDTFGLGSDFYKVDPDCLLGAVYVDGAEPTDYDALKFQIICASCKPGFRATNIHKNGVLIRRACNAITGCKASPKMANGCEECVASKILKYSDNSIQYDSEDTCLTLPTVSFGEFDNCMAASLDPDNAGKAKKCMVCKRGYQLNPDSVCEQVTAANCSATGFRSISTYDFTIGELDNINWILYVQRTTTGCHICDSTYSAIKMTQEINFCALSAWYTANGENISVESNLTAKCIKFSGTNSENPYCAECNATQTGLSTVGSYPLFRWCADAGLGNCKVYRSTTKCFECTDKTFAIADGVCTAGSIVGCDEYVNSGLGDTNQCSKCKTTHSLIINKTECRAGNIAGCEIYSYDTEVGDVTCKFCEPGKIIVNGACVTSDPFCGNFSIADDNSVTCQECLDSSYSMINGICARGNIQNCLSFNHDTNESVMTCKICQPGFTLVSNECIAPCLLPKDAQDSCTKCPSGTAFSRNNNKCMGVLDFMTDQCDIDTAFDETQDVNLTAVTCISCKENAYPYDFINQFVCIANSSFDEYPGDISLVNDCIKYDENKACIQCDPTSANFLLRSGTSCSNECGDGAVKSFERVKLIFDNDSNKTQTQISQFNVCEASDTPDCLFKAPNLANSTLNPICVVCKSTHFMLANLTADPLPYTNIDISDSASYPYIQKPFFKYTIGACTAKAGATFNSAGDLIDNCDSYIVVASSNYTCLKCKHGYSGKPTATAGEITCVDDSSNCDTSVVYTNLHSTWAALFSCHKCKTGIPYLGFKTSANGQTGFNGWGKWETTISDNTFAKSDSTENTMICEDNTGGSNWSPATLADLDETCGLGAVSITATATTDLVNNTYQIFCAGCKPGYAAQYDDEEPVLISNCTEITNCDTSTSMANGCEACTNDYILTFANNTIDYTSTNTCISKNGNHKLFLNCLAATKNGDGNAEACAVCKPSYSLNADGVCDKLTPANCKTDQFRISSLDTFAGFADWLLYSQGNGVGCNFCEANYSAIKINSSLDVCIASTYIGDNVDEIGNIANTVFIPFCEQYDGDIQDPLQCYLCDPGYVLKTNKQECIEGTANPDCRVASDASTCTECVNDSYSLVSNKCKYGNIHGCATYVHNTSNASITCNTCEEGLTKNGTNDECSADCINAGSDDPCTCASNLFVNKDGDKCISALPYIDDKCDDFGTENGHATSITGATCKSCKEHTYPITTENLFVCVPDSQIGDVIKDFAAKDGCVQYESNNNCIKCDPNTPAKSILANDQSACSAACDTDIGYDRVLLDIKDSTGEIVQYNTCRSDTNSDNCMVYLPDFIDLPVSLCVQCKASFYLKITLTDTKYTGFDGSASASYPYLPARLFKYPSGVCIDNNSGADTINTTSDCDYHFQSGDNVYDCLKCRHGYTASNDGSGVLTCTADTDCDSSKYLGNLSLYWSRLFSCHVCKNDKIPFLAFEEETDNKLDFGSWKKWADVVADVVAAGSYKDAAGANNNIVCKPVSGTAGWFDVADNSLPAECALAVVNLKAIVATDLATDKYRIVCVACRHGYIPTYDGSSGSLGDNVVASCAAISNCDTNNGSIVDGCELCSENHVLKYDTTNSKVLFSDSDSCVPVDTTKQYLFENCWAGPVNNANVVETCTFCKKGYQKNDDGYCEAINPINCKNEMFRRARKDSLLNSVDWVFYNQTYSTGCDSCQEGFISTSLKTNKNICVYSDWLEDHIFRAESSEYPQHCEHIDATILNTKDTSYKCKHCIADYSVSGNSCIKNPDCSGGDVWILNACVTNTMPGCTTSEANDDHTALICTACNNATFALVNNQCITNALANCAEYVHNANDTVAKCIKCTSNAYALVNNVCKEDPVPSCIEYEFETNQTEPKCTKCINDNFFLKAGVCVREELDGCRFYQHNEADATVALCRECLDDTWALSNKKCLPCNAKKCKECNNCGGCDHCDVCDYLRDADPDGTNSGKKNCYRCDSHTTDNSIHIALNDGTCEVGNLTQCVDYIRSISIVAVGDTPAESQPTKQLCTECNDSTHGLVSHACIKSISDNCATYDNTTAGQTALKCESCNSELFGLNNNTCLANQITNCKKYTGKNETLQCTECTNSSFALTNNKVCDNDSSDKCATYIHVTAGSGATRKCLTCDVDTHGIKNQACVTDALPHCVKYDLTTSSKCEECIDNEHALFNDGCVVGSLTGCFKFSFDDITVTKEECTKCLDETWALVAKKCVKGTLLGCKDFEYENNTTKEECTKCLDETWALVAKKCEKGTIPGCTKFEHDINKLAQECTQCDDNTYWLNTAKTACAKGTLSDCVAFNFNTANTETCEKCYNYTFSLNSGVCAENPVTNCMSHEYEDDDNTNTCDLCKSDSFPLLNGACAAGSDSNCISYIFDVQHPTARCRKCVNDTFALNNYVCVSDPISKCEKYAYKDHSGASKCVECEEGHGLVNGTACTATPIDNCLKYNRSIVRAAVHCLECETGFGLVNNTSCTRTVIDNCNVYNTTQTRPAVHCIECFDGFGLVDNTSCSSREIENCAVFNTDDSQSEVICKECDAGYGLVNNTNCTKGDIDDCDTYNTDKIEGGNIVCTACKAGFGLVNNTTCTEGNITGCASYNTNKIEGGNVICTACNNTHGLVNNTTCTEGNISGCASYNSDKIEGGNVICTACNSTHGLVNNTTCTEGTDNNCATYNVDEIIGGQVRCLKCKSDAFALVDYVCVDGDLSNCDAHNYQTNSNVKQCTACTDSAYALVNHNCVENAMTGCSKYVFDSNSTKPKCTQCEDNSWALINNVCYKGNISGCNSYQFDTNGTEVICTACKAGGFTLKDNTCTSLCKTWRNCEMKCTSCPTGLAISTDSESCVEPLPFIGKTCKTNNLTADSVTEQVLDVSCSVCANQTIPIPFQNQFACLPKADLRNIHAKEPVSDCIRYNDDMECLECNPDSDNRYLKSDFTCSDKCEDGRAGTFALMTVKLTNANAKVEVSSFNVCQSEIRGCLMTVPDLSKALLNQTCAKCESESYFPVNDFKNPSFTNLNTSDDATYPYQVAPYFMYPTVKCVPKKKMKINNTPVDTYDFDDNCEVYLALGDNDHTCLRCEYGKTATIDGNGYLTCEDSGSNCSTDRLHNIGLYWEKIFSCHVCTTGTHIPFIGYMPQPDQPLIKNWTKWASAKTDNNFESSLGTNRNIICAANHLSTFGVGIAGDFAVPENCALGVVILNETTATNLGTTYQIFCASCKPGFSSNNQAIDTNKAWARVDCTAIPGCAANTTMANGCSECGEKKILKYDGGIKYKDNGACIVIADADAFKFVNCLAASDSSGADTCMVCKAGYQLNLDSICERVTPNSCKMGRYRKVGGETFTNGETANINYILYNQYYSTGCSRCEDGYYAALITTDINICVQSDWLDNSVDSKTDAETNYAPKCQNYNAGNASSLTCNTCDPDHVVNGTGDTPTRTACFINTNLANCGVASNANTCTACESMSYPLVNTACLTGTINNCLKYDHTNGGVAQVCIECTDNTYALVNNTCTKGTMPSCLNFDHVYDKSDDQTKERCTKCATTHGLVDSICTEGSIDNCGKYNFETNHASAVFCTECSTDQFNLMTNGLSCTSTEIPGCAKYRYNTPGSNAQCLECELTHSLMTGKTSCSTTTIDNCGKHRYNVEGSSDQCIECDSDQFALVNNTCEAGAKNNCAKYHHNQTHSPQRCIECTSDQYGIFNHDCAEGSIDNCAAYNYQQNSSTAVQCTKCDDNTYYLSDNQCRKGNLTGCVKYMFEEASAKEQCIECEDNTYALVDGACVKSTAVNGCVAYNFNLNHPTAAQCTECGDQTKSLQNNTCADCEMYSCAKYNYDSSNSVGQCTECIDNTFALVNHNCVKGNKPFCATYNHNANADEQQCRTCTLINYEVVDHSCSIILAPNCASATGSSVCIRCVSDQFALVNNTCVSGTLSDCVAYTYDSNTDSQHCTLCKDNSVGLLNHKCISVSNDHCATYIHNTNSDKLKCLSCDSTKYALISQECVLGNIPQCNAYNHDKEESKITCRACDDGHYLTPENTCLKGSVANCKTFLHDADRLEGKCVTCEPDYYLKNNNTCELGKIPNCKVFVNSTPNQCSVCQDGFVLTAVGEDMYCFPVNEAFNCTDLSYTSEGGATASCNSCTDPKNYLKVAPKEEESKSICMPFSTINNCAEYDVNSSLTDSSFRCTKCEVKYYYNGDTNTCVERINQPTKCITYHVTKDECIACSEDSFLDNENKECKDFPTGIVGCEEYQDLDTCSKCQDGHYLSDSKCHLADPKIANCKTYSSNDVCSECKDGFAFATPEKCEVAVASDCVTYTDVNTCETCAAKDGLVNDSGVTSCVTQDLKGCILVNDVSLTCDECSKDFYLDKGECKDPTIIPNCEYYAGKETCKKCFTGFALAANKKSCEINDTIRNYIPANCDDAALVGIPVCSRCAPGYWFNGESCVPLCVDNGVDGCFTCDPETPSKCFICKTGYSMKEEGKCTNNIDGDDDIFTEKTSILGLIGLMSVLIALIV